jgi:hypothetical protein
MSQPLFVSFVAGSVGSWRIDRIDIIAGAALPSAERVRIEEGVAPATDVNSGRILRGTTSNVRYTNRLEVDALAVRQERLGRPQATLAALIPIRKSEAWWGLAQDERRRVFEESSHHIEIGMRYLPAIARRLHHSRELGAPFDFLTWFEYAPEDAPAFDDLVCRLRGTEEWNYVDREVDIRLIREEPTQRKR